MTDPNPLNMPNEDHYHADGPFFEKKFGQLNHEMRPVFFARRAAQSLCAPSLLVFGSTRIAQHAHLLKIDNELATNIVNIILGANLIAATVCTLLIHKIRRDIVNKEGYKELAKEARRVYQPEQLSRMGVTRLKKYPHLKMALYGSDDSSKLLPLPKDLGF